MFTQSLFRYLMLFFILFSTQETAAFFNKSSSPRPLYTQSFVNSDCALNVALNPLGDTDYSFQVNTIGNIGIDVFLEEVSLKIEHDYDNDLTVDLISPSGTVVNLFTHIGEASDNFGDINESGSCNSTTRLVSTYSDEYCDAIPIENAEAPFIGYYRPMEDLSTFWDAQPATGEWTLRINDNHQEHTGSLLHVSLLFSSPYCQRPVLDSIWTDTDGSMGLLVSEGLDCERLIVEWGPHGFTPGIGVDSGDGEDMVIFPSCSSPFVVNGILPQQMYEVYLRKECIDGAWSENSCLTQLQSTCADASLSHISDFNMEMLCSPDCGQTCFMSGDWRNTSGGDCMDWSIREGGANIGDSFSSGIGNFLYLDDNCFGVDSTVLYSSCFNILSSDPTACHFSFDYMLEGTAVTDFNLEISTDGGFHYESIWSVPLDRAKDVWIREFVNLTEYHGLSVQFRIFVKRNNQIGGYVSLDNIQFYGSAVLGFPTNVFFVDSDMDSYGDSSNFRPTCSNVAQSGFTLIGGDCDDHNDGIHPEAEEGPCNGIDENCNGMLDDLDLPSPTVGPALYICNTGEAYVNVPVNEGNYPVFWYKDSIGGPVDITGDQNIVTELLFNPGADTLVFTYYAEFRDGACRSSERSAYTINVLPDPKLSLAFGQDFDFCPEEEIDLSSILINDLHGVSQNFVYFEDQALENQIGDPGGFILEQQQSIWILASTAAGCEADLEIPLELFPAIDLEISGPSELCPGDSFDLLGSWSSEIEEDDLSFLWSTGDENISLSDSFPDHSDTLIYWLRAEDLNHCISLDSFSVLKGGSIDSIDLLVTNLSACNLQDGSIHIKPYGGQGPFQYLLTSNVLSLEQESIDTVLFSGLAQGVYHLSIIDLSEPDCVFDYPEAIILTGGAAELFIEEEKDVSCADLDNGLIRISVSGLDPQVTWSNGSNDPEQITNLSAGTYGFTVTDGLCETIVDDIVINSPDPLVIQILDYSETVSCNGLEDGFIESFAQGGSQPYTYLWTGTTGETLVSGLAAGFYELSVEDANGCVSAAEEIDILEPEQMSLDAMLNLPTCYNTEDGSINLFVSGGSGAYQYEWGTGLGLQILNDVGLGEYSVTVSDENSCLLVESFVLEGLEPIDLSIFSVVEPTCEGVSDGAIEFFVSGGHEGYEYLWSDGSTEQLRSDLGIGDYSLNITDAENCTSVEAFSFDPQESISFDYEIDAATCDGIADGTILFGNEEGQGSLMYSFFMEGVAFNNGSLSQGEVLIAAVDSRGCTDTVRVDHIAEQPLEISVIMEQPNCKGQETGQIGAIALGTGFPFTYEWADGFTGANRTGLLDGRYILEVTSSDECSIKDTFDLVALSSIKMDILEIDSVSCSGREDGAILLDVSGGIEPYAYSWSNGDITKNLSGIGQGLYNFNVVDALNCAFEYDFTLNDVSPMNVNLNYSYIEAFPCDNKPVSSIEVEVTGGRAPYLGEWSDGQETLFFDEPEVGNYDLAVMDSYGCIEKFTNINIKEDPMMMNVGLTYDVDSSALCTNGYLVESADFQLLSGQGSWSYQWVSEGGLSGQGNADDDYFSFNASEFAMHDFQFEDENGCTFSIEDVYFEQIEPLNILLEDFTTISCYAYTDGFLAMSLEGGAAPFEFEWTLNEESFDGSLVMNDLSSGTYSLVATDHFNCMDSVSVVLADLEPLDVNLEFANQNFCYGDSNVLVATVNLSDGLLSDYSFEWSNGATVVNPSNLSSGPLGLTLTSENCVYEFTDFEVPGSFDGPLLIDEEEMQVNDPLCGSEPDGSISLEIEGGTKPYSFVWNNNIGSIDLSQDSILNITGLASGNYSLTVNDANGCTYSIESIALSADDIWEVSYEAEPCCFNEESALVSFTYSGGVSPFAVNWTMGDQSGTATEGLAPGLYEFDLNDNLNCKESFLIDLQISPEIVISDSTIVHPSDGENNGSIQVFTSPYIDNLSLSWEIGDSIYIGSQVFNLFSGDYTLTAIDSFSCQDTFTFSLSDPTVGLPGVQWERSIQSYPNPTSGVLNLRSEAEPLGDIELILLDMKGAIRYSEKINAQFHHQLDLPEHLAAGSYILLLQQKNKIIWASDLQLITD